MPSKRIRGTKPATGAAGDTLRVETERLIEKERFKDAVKQAKLCFKAESSPENRRLLEQAYFLRARQLARAGMRASAIEVAQHLLEFGVTPSDWAHELVGLLMDLGLGQEAVLVGNKVGTPELKEQMVVMAADGAVIHPDRANGNPAEIAGQATLIRQALERLEHNDEASALLLLRDLPRGSLLSEWKFFVRGLAAYYRHDADDTKANWDRLDSKRKACRIAERLLALAHAGGANTAVPNTESLEKRAFGEPVLDRLRKLRGLAASQDWDKVIGQLGAVRQSLRRIDPGLAGRLTGALLGSLIKDTEDVEFDDTVHLVDGFIKVAEPLGFDPHWNRLKAIIWDGPNGDPDESLAYWVKYTEDLKSVTVFNSTERTLAQALVWNHIAEVHRDLAADLSEPEGPFGLPFFIEDRAGIDPREVARARKQVVDCLEKSLSLAPGHRPTYELLVEVYRGWEDRPKLEAAARRLLAKFPDDLNTLTLLANEYLQNDEPAKALPLVQTARGLKPLDDSLRGLEWTVRVGLARMHAHAKLWEAGRDEFTAADRLLPERRNDFIYLARKIVFEAKASQSEQSDRYLEQARASLAEPAPLWLALSIESIRFGMTKATQKGYNELWEADLKKKCVSETAGHMASLLDAFLSTGIEYAGRAGHIKKVVAYLRRTTRLDYRCVDIERVCEFLDHLEAEGALLEKLVKLGVKQHPRSVMLNFRAGLVEISKGPFNLGGQRALNYLETAKKLAESSSEPKESALVPQIQKALTLLNEAGSMAMSLPSFGDGPPGFPFPFLGDHFIDDFDDLDDDGIDDDDDAPRPPPGPRPASKASKQKPRKKR